MQNPRESWLRLMRLSGEARISQMNQIIRNDQDRNDQDRNGVISTECRSS